VRPIGETSAVGTSRGSEVNRLSSHVATREGSSQSAEFFLFYFSFGLQATALA